ncbi:amidoligase family protein [Dyadobacter sp. 32]|uniref:amidoligase family protein n=1 Tax=Dyadobacter sp. 32 TaxID=538966 RepID=UPI0011EFBCAA
MNTQFILSDTTTTKTEKIRQLLALGLTRKQVSELAGCGYGFVQNVFAKHWPERVQTKQLSFVPFNRKFGIEIEAYGIDKRELARLITSNGVECLVEGYNHTTRSHWKIVTDGSLRGDNAFEIVSPILKGLEGLRQLEVVSAALTTLRAKINRTCGLHIHFDASGFEAEQIKNLLKNYANYENLIDSFMPESRRKNNNTYCKSITGIVGQLSGASTIQEMASIQNSRYYKVNLQSYLRHKSIEFRQHGGTVELEKIKSWILFLHNLVEFSKTKTVTAAQANFESLTKFQQPEIMNYIQTRINNFAA